MKILHLIPGLTGGGAERQLAYLAGEMVRRNHEVLIAFRLTEGMGRWDDGNVPTVRLDVGGAWNPRLVTRVVALIREMKPDVVQTWNLQMDVVGGIAAAITGTPWLVREPTVGALYGKGIKPFLRLAIARVAGAAVVANSPGGMDYWSQHAPGLKRRLIGNAISIEAIDRTPPADFGGRQTGIIASRLEALKNVDIALTAVAAAMAANDFDLVICGDGPERSGLESTARSLGIERRVRFAGFVPDVWNHLKGGAFFLSLSDFEGSPNAVLEAFAAGTPAILSDIPAHRAIADESCAYFVPVRDANATAAAIETILRDPEGASARARTARRRVEARSVAAMTDAFEQAYGQLLSRS